MTGCSIQDELFASISQLVKVAAMRGEPFDRQALIADDPLRLLGDHVVALQGHENLQMSGPRPMHATICWYPDYGLPLQMSGGPAVCACLCQSAVVFVD